MSRSNWARGCCYACDFSWRESTGIPRRSAAELYELAVEAVEASAGGTFTLSQIWEVVLAGARERNIQASRYRAIWASTVRAYVSHALYDMAGHGLVRCVRRRAGTRRPCMEWELTELSSVA